MDSADEDLDALVRRADIDRWLSTRFVADAEQRADLIALYAFDHELARALKVTSNPLLAEIRLTWWREMLDEVYERRPMRRHPTAQALAAAIERRKLPREPLEDMIDGRLLVLGEDAVGGHVAATGVTWAAALILDPDTPKAAIGTGKLSAAAFPALLPLASRDAVNPVAKRLWQVWAVLRGRV